MVRVSGSIFSPSSCSRRTRFMRTTSRNRKGTERAQRRRVCRGLQCGWQETGFGLDGQRRSRSGTGAPEGLTTLEGHTSTVRSVAIQPRRSSSPRPVMTPPSRSGTQPKKRCELTVKVTATNSLLLMARTSSLPATRPRSTPSARQAVRPGTQRRQGSAKVRNAELDCRAVRTADNRWAATGLLGSHANLEPHDQGDRHHRARRNRQRRRRLTPDGKAL